MSPSELDESLIAEREQCVASLPYHQLLQNETIREEEEAEEETETIERARSDGTERCKVAHNNESSTRHTLPSYASVSSGSPASPLSESPLCPSVSLGRRVYVYLASNDDITPSRTIQLYLESCFALEERKWGRGEAMVNMRVFQDVGHAECLFHANMKNEIVQQIQTQPSHAQMTREVKIKQNIRTNRGAQTPM